MAAKSELNQSIENIRARFFSNCLSEKPEESICAVADEHLKSLWASKTAPPGCAVMAIGGFGRGVLHPKSDLDLMIFFMSEVIEETVKEILLPLWDLGFRVGHQVRTLADFRSFQLDHLESYTAFLEARFLWGDRKLVSFFRDDVLAGLIGRHQKTFLQTLLEMKEDRYQRYGGTVFQLEPDIKEAPGGLRDFHWTQWTSRVLGKSVSSPPFEAVAFLHRLRNFLHFMSGRDENQLSYEYQERIATQLNYQNSLRGDAAEKLMRDYFLQAADISESVSRLSFEIIGHPHTLSVKRTPEDALEMMEVFTESHRLKRTLDVSMIDSLRARVRFFPDTSFQESDLAHSVLEIMKDPEGIYCSLSLMHRVGFLGRIFPQFEELRCRVIRDFFHKYTVDEHSLIAIRNIEELREGKSKGPRGGFRTILSEIENPELLLFALLMHDIGKSAQHPDGDHVCSSVDALESVLEKIHLPEEQEDRIRAVIKNHLEMSKVILRRDITDPDVVAAFAERVETIEDLRMLCLLTYADMKAVSPEVLTSWKEELLWQLYVSTHNHLLHGFADDRYAGGKELEAELKSILGFVNGDVSVDEFRAFLQGFPRQYLRMTSRAQIAEHFIQYRHFVGGKVMVMHLNQSEGLCDILVITKDRRRLFSRITGVLSAYGMNIVRAHAFSNDSGVVFDLITFEDLKERLIKNPSEVDRLQETMEGAITGDVPVDRLLRQKSGSVVYQRRKGTVPTTIHFDEKSSSRCTILEITTHDHVGLLFNISSVLSDHGCNVEVALITTEGSRAIDVFYLTKGEERISGQLQACLREKLTDAIASLS